MLLVAHAARTRKRVLKILGDSRVFKEWLGQECRTEVDTTWTCGWRNIASSHRDK